MGMEEEEGWTVVVGRSSKSGTKAAARKKKKKKEENGVPFAYSNLPEAPAVADEVEEIRRKVKRSMDRLRDSVFYPNFLAQLRSPPLLQNLRRISMPPQCRHATRKEGDKEKEEEEREVKEKGEKEKEGMKEKGEKEKREKKEEEEREVKEKEEKKEEQEREVKEKEMEGKKEKEEKEEKEVKKKKEEEEEKNKVEKGEKEEEKEEKKKEKGKAEFEEEEKKKKEEDKSNAEIEEKEKEKGCAEIEDKEEEKTKGNIEIILDFIVYGIGSISDSEASRCQFSLILLLKQSFPWVGQIEIYDPVLSSSEREAIEALGCHIITSNEEGKRSVEKPTVFYMPHCEEWLYNNVLEANWCPQKLNRLAILGNSFRSYQEKHSSLALASRHPNLRSHTPFLLKLQPLAIEIPVKDTSIIHLPELDFMVKHTMGKDHAMTDFLLRVLLEGVEDELLDIHLFVAELVNDWYDEILMFLEIRKFQEGMSRD